MQANPPISTTVMHSAPVYSAAALSKSAAHHLVFVADAPATELDSLLQSAQPAETANITVVGGEGPSTDDLGSMKGRLRELLAHALIGTHLYLLGSQSVVWALYNLARDMGMRSEEISLLLAQGTARSMYCVHCSLVQSVGEGATADCAGCGVRLFVRDHFSRRLGAFMGVCEDADHPRGKPLR